MSRIRTSILARLAFAWLPGVLAISSVSAQACDGIEVQIGAREQQCLKPGTGQSFKDCADCVEMVVVPAGTFTMGTPPGEEVATEREREDQLQVSIAAPFADTERVRGIRGSNRPQDRGRLLSLRWIELEVRGGSRLARPGHSAG